MRLPLRGDRGVDWRAARVWWHVWGHVVNDVGVAGMGMGMGIRRVAMFSNKWATEGGYVRRVGKSKAAVGGIVLKKIYTRLDYFPERMGDTG